MKPKSHKRLTEFAIDMLSQTVKYFVLEGVKDQIAQQAHDTDYAQDLEFVDVESDRDNPHKDAGFWVDDDKAHYYDASFDGAFGKHYFTAFNHFIDIRKGKENAMFDDFDGYSYHHGSASKSQHEDYEFLGLGIKKIDEGIKGWLNDEYVHVPGRAWYRDTCSTSVRDYSFPSDKGIYDTTTDEGLARFPLADSRGKENMGIPYSVFMPVDNLARYWDKNYRTSTEHNPKDLGYVMHAIQDASIPHHAAGYCGNWHGKYEETVRDRLEGWIGDATFQKDIKELFTKWNELDPSPPSTLDDGDESTKSPRRNWRIEWLVTWMALNAYHAYREAHSSFANGWTDNGDSMKELTKKATAISMLALYEASILELCRGFDPNRLAVKSQWGKWCVGELHTTGIIPSPLEKFSTQEEANRCLEIMRHYEMNSRMEVGKTPYYLTNGNVPGFTLPPFSHNALGGENMAVFNREQIEVRRNGMEWVIAQGNNVIIDFLTSRGDAMRTYHAIQKYDFNRYCWLGNRDVPSMRYFLAGPDIGHVVVPVPAQPSVPTLPTSEPRVPHQ